MARNRSFTFIHAADLHLDSPFKGLRAPDASIVDALRSATFDAFSALIDLCIDRDVGFLLVAGDVYDAEDRSLRAQLRFRDGLARLAEKGIETFVVHGNHDPYGSGSSAIRWPVGVRVFGQGAVESAVACVKGEPVATISGISHAKRNERQNLASRFTLPGEDLFRIALLHCNVGSASGHEPYAPCELSDLIESGFDYWALGHVHQWAVLANSPHVVYSGNVQGRHFGETGARGCHLVTVEGGEVTNAEFCPLDRVRWLEGSIDIGCLSTIDELDRAIVDSVQGLLRNSADRSAVCRMKIEGRGSLYGELRRPGSVEALLERARESFQGDRPFVWLDELIVNCRPDREIERRREAGDFLAEVLSISEEVARSPERTRQLAGMALSDLTTNRQIEKAIGGFDDEEIAAMAAEAELICIDMLEGQE